MWNLHECANLDSCDQGQTHLYPEPNTVVEVRAEVEARVVGSTEQILVPPGRYKVDHCLHETHEAAILVVHPAAEDLVVAWFDIEDVYAPRIFGEGA